MVMIGNALRSINKTSKNDIEGEREQALVDQWVGFLIEIIVIVNILIIISANNLFIITIDVNFILIPINTLNIEAMHHNCKTNQATVPGIAFLGVL